MTLEGVHKRFGATRALDDAGITLVSGEVHALVGENGAGKSTLIKVMTGIYQPDEGSITIDGVAAELTSSAEAQARGIVAIYQEPMIYPDLSVAENIFIGHRNRGRLVHWRRMYDEADAILRSLDIDVDARAPANTLAVAAQQAVEIAKAISLDARVLIMDEPTASLSAHEVDRLFDQVGELRAAGSPCSSSAIDSTRCSGSPTASPCSATAGTSRPVRRRTPPGIGSFERWSGGTSATSSCARGTSPARPPCGSRGWAAPARSRT